MSDQIETTSVRTVITYRKATLDDLDRLIELGEVMHAESPAFSFLTYNKDMLTELVRKVIEQGSVFIAESETGLLIGMFVGIIQDYFFSEELVGYDLAIYVHPDHRQGRTAIRLIKMFEEWCFKHCNCGVVSLSANTGIQGEKTARLFNRLGYETIGYKTMKRNPADV